MKLRPWLASCLAATCLAAGVGSATAQTTYTINGTAGFQQDLDSADGFVYQTEFAAGQTWSAEVVLPALASLALSGNTQSQGGSRTDYIAVTLTSLSITRTGGAPIVLATPSAPLTGLLRFWHRASALQHFAEFRFTIGSVPTQTTITLSLNAQQNDDAAYDLLFVQGTPNPNTPDANYFPAFNTTGLRDGQYRTTSLAIDAFAPIFPGRGRYNGDMQTFVNPADPNPTPGACCFPNGTCRLTNLDGCNTANGFTWFSGQTCSPSPCPPPVGSCCGISGNCTLTTQTGCPFNVGQWSQTGVCTPNTCPILGACCFSDGFCVFTTQVACDPDPWDGNATCAPNPCPQPTGACCDSTQTCTITTQAECDLSGTYLGDGVACGPTTCNPGACCDTATGACTFFTLQECDDASGEFRGVGVPCMPDPCSGNALTITKSGSGSGLVVSNPVGIDCGATCTANFPIASTVSLFAVASSTSVFTGWSGDCLGLGTCNVTMDMIRNVTANFRCNADFNGVGGVTVQDIFDYLAAYFAGAPGADFNGVGGVTVQDIFDFLAAYFQGC